MQRAIIVVTDKCASMTYHQLPYHKHPPLLQLSPQQCVVHRCCKHTACFNRQQPKCSVLPFTPTSLSRKRGVCIVCRNESSSLSLHWPVKMLVAPVQSGETWVRVNLTAQTAWQMLAYCTASVQQMTALA